MKALQNKNPSHLEVILLGKAPNLQQAKCHFLGPPMMERHATLERSASKRGSADLVCRGNTSQQRMITQRIHGDLFHSIPIRKPCRVCGSISLPLPAATATASSEVSRSRSSCDVVKVAFGLAALLSVLLNFAVVRQGGLWGSTWWVGEGQGCPRKRFTGIAPRR